MTKSPSDKILCILLGSGHNLLIEHDLSANDFLANIQTTVVLENPVLYGPGPEPTLISWSEMYRSRKVTLNTSQIVGVCEVEPGTMVSNAYDKHAEFGADLLKAEVETLREIREAKKED